MHVHCTCASKIVSSIARNPTKEEQYNWPLGTSLEILFSLLSKKGLPQICPYLFVSFEYHERCCEIQNRNSKNADIKFYSIRMAHFLLDGGYN